MYVADSVIPSELCHMARPHWNQGSPRELCTSCMCDTHDFCTPRLAGIKQREKRYTAALDARPLWSTWGMSNLDIACCTNAQVPYEQLDAHAPKEPQRLPNA
jgi:hypothetical protein